MAEHRIMISDAINASDRLSSCSKRVRKKITPDAGVFRSTRSRSGALEATTARLQRAEWEEMILNYNVGGICLSETAFQKLEQRFRWRPGRRTVETRVSKASGSTSSASSLSVPFRSRTACSARLRFARIALPKSMFETSQS